VAGCCEHGNEPLDFLQCGELLTFVEEDCDVVLVKGLWLRWRVTWC
jgi:hypothetical protein